MQSIFITGAAGGIGGALTQRAVLRGDRVIAGVYSEAEAASLSNAANLLVVRIDVSDSASVEQAFDEADAWLAGMPLNAVINCAAVCPLGAVEVLAPEVLLNTLNTNAVGSARILRAALPRLRGHSGRIALVTSLWGKVAGPMLSAYCASKFAIEAVVDAARRETNGQGVGIILIEPGVVRTDLVARQVAEAKAASATLPVEHAPQYSALYRKYAAMIERNSGGGVSADECARQIERAVTASRPRTRYRVGMDSKAVTTLARLLPDRALDAMFRSLLK